MAETSGPPICPRCGLVTLGMHHSCHPVHQVEVTRGEQSDPVLARIADALERIATSLEVSE